MTSHLSPPPQIGPHIGALDLILPDEASARAQFSQARAYLWRDALDPALLARLIALCDRGDFRSDQVADLGHRDIEAPPLAGTALSLALRRPALFSWLERVTGVEPIEGVEGRVVRTWPRPGDELDWHDDMNGAQRRLLGVTIALGTHAYEGGAFEMRRSGTNEPLWRGVHDTPGNLLIFEVSWACEHRVLPLTSGGPRQVFTGWFVG